jgi:hypothetical protein
MKRLLAGLPILTILVPLVEGDPSGALEFVGYVLGILGFLAACAPVVTLTKYALTGEWWG